MNSDSNSAATTLTQQKPRLWRSTTLVASLTMLSRVLGFVRDMTLASLFGAAAGTDAFFIAFKIPNFMRRLFAEGAFSQAFVPILSEYQKQKDKEDVKQFVSHIAGSLSITLLLLTFLAILAAPLLITLFTPGLTDANDVTRFTLATNMLRITFPYLLFISLTALTSATLNVYGNFSVPAFTPILLNLSLIGAAFFLAPHITPSSMALAWGVLIAGVAQLAFQLPFLHRQGMLTRPRINWHDAGVRRVLKQMVPALLGSSVIQVNLLLDTLFVSFLPTGSMSWLFYSERLTGLPLGVFGVALSTVILPYLSRENAQRSKDAFSQTLDWALRNFLLIGVPSMIGLFLLSYPILMTLFYRGRFTLHDVNMTRLSLMAFAVGIPGVMAVKILSTGFYATQNIRTPVRIAIIAMVVNLVFNLILIGPLAHAGLALATSFASLLNAILLLYQLMRQKVFKAQVGWLLFLERLIFANLAMAAVLLWQTPTTSQWLMWHWTQRLLHLLLLITIAIITYIVSLRITGLRLKDILR